MDGWRPTYPSERAYVVTSAPTYDNTEEMTITSSQFRFGSFVALARANQASDLASSRDQLNWPSWLWITNSEFGYLCVSALSTDSIAMHCFPYDPLGLGHAVPCWLIPCVRPFFVWNACTFKYFLNITGRAHFNTCIYIYIYIHIYIYI